MSRPYYFDYADGPVVVYGGYAESDDPWLKSVGSPGIIWPSYSFWMVPIDRSKEGLPLRPARPEQNKGQSLR